MDRARRERVLPEREGDRETGEHLEQPKKFVQKNLATFGTDRWKQTRGQSVSKLFRGLF